MQQNLTEKIYHELDMIRILSKMLNFTVENKAENIEHDCIKLVLKDIEERCWHVSEWVENIENIQS